MARRPPASLFPSLAKHQTLGNSGTIASAMAKVDWSYHRKG